MKFRRIDHIRKRASWTRTGPQWPRGKFFTQLCGLPVSNGYVVAGAVVPAKTKCRRGWGITTHVEAKSIAFILRKEKGKGWQRPQNPNNPGFDLYQTDRRGRVICWCEVKGLSGKFSRISLTKTEFEEARKRGERYWLYIVENVGRGKPNLIRIKDPAGKADRFTYRHPAWRNAADK